MTVTLDQEITESATDANWTNAEWRSVTILGTQYKIFTADVDGQAGFRKGFEIGINLGVATPGWELTSSSSVLRSRRFRLSGKKQLTRVFKCIDGKYEPHGWTPE